MYQGRHCTYKDYQHLSNITDDVLELSNVDDQSLKQYLNEINDYDYLIAEKMRNELFKERIDNQKRKDIIKEFYQELSKNVLVDIQEHK